MLAQKLQESLQLKIRFLASITILNDVTNSETRRLLAEQGTMRIVRAKDNTCICKEGTPITHLILVKSGHLRTLKRVHHPGRKGRNLLIEVQTLAPADFFGENSFRHIPVNALRSLRNAKKQKRNSLRQGKGVVDISYGTYLASLVSKTYCELYEIPISIAHAILSKEAIQKLMVYGNEREHLYEQHKLANELKETIKAKKFRRASMNAQTYVST